MSTVRGSARKLRRQSMGVFNRHRVLNQANDRLEERRSKTPEWKVKLLKQLGRDQ